MRRKYSIDYIKSIFNKEGYILLTSIYKNNKGKLNYICPNGHNHSVSLRNWLCNKNRCPFCKNLVKKDIEYIRKSFMKEDYTLLTNKYFNNHQELRYICPNGHHHYISWGNWQQGRRCPCFSNRPPITLEFIKKEFEKENYVLLSTEYKNAHQKLNFICDGRHGKKHRGEMSWSNWNHPKKYRCGECFKISQIGSGHWNWQGGLSFQEYCEAWKDKEYKKFIKERDGFKCMNPFCNSRGEVILSIHHIDYDKKNCSPNNLITLCRACNSKANIDREWHKSFYNTIVFRRNYNNKSR